MMTDTETATLDDILEAGGLNETDPDLPKPAETGGEDGGDKPQEGATAEGGAAGEKPGEADAQDQRGGTVPHEALHSERERRKAAEDRVDKLTSYFEKLVPILTGGNKPAGEGGDKAKEPGFYDDPAGFVSRQMQTMEQAVSQQMGNLFYAVQEQIAQARYTDYDEKFAKFEELAKTNPSLLDALRQQPQPGIWLYGVAKRAMELEALGSTDLETLRQKIREEELAKLKAEAGGQPQQGGDGAAGAGGEYKGDLPPVNSPAPGEEGEKPPAPNIPKSLAGKRSAGPATPRSGPKFSGPTPLSELVDG